jgi:hypothetical protein
MKMKVIPAALMRDIASLIMTKRVRFRQESKRKAIFRQINVASHNGSIKSEFLTN